MGDPLFATQLKEFLFKLILTHTNTLCLILGPLQQVLICGILFGPFLREAMEIHNVRAFLYLSFFVLFINI